MKKSVFRKLRISSQWINDILVGLGFRVATVEAQMGMVWMVAHKH